MVFETETSKAIVFRMDDHKCFVEELPQQCSSLSDHAICLYKVIRTLSELAEMNHNALPTSLCKHAFQFFQQHVYSKVFPTEFSGMVWNTCAYDHTTCMWKLSHCERRAISVITQFCKIPANNMNAKSLKSLSFSTKEPQTRNKQPHPPLKAFMESLSITGVPNYIKTSLWVNS